MINDLFDETSRDEPERSRRRRGGWGRRIRRTVIVLVCAALLVVAGAAGYLGYLNSKVDDIQREALLPAPGGGGTAGGDPSKTTTGTKLVTGQGTNYLVIGSDARPGETASRADVIQLVHVPKDSSGVYLIHFPRDLYVDIPGRGKDKINASFAYGGAPLLVQTLQDLLGVKIDHVAKTDFEGFKQMTDAVGGVRVYAEQASSSSGNGGVAIQKGWNDLNGEQALGFVRERYQLSQGDISRGQRQQAWLKAIMTKTLTPGVLLNPAKFSSFVQAGTSNSIVDDTLTTSKIRSQALKLRGVRGDDIHFVTAPFSGYGTTSGGASIVVLDEPGMDRLSDALATDNMAGFTE
ncbi:LCP family protein [Janibacter endophyticus]|uniref:LCP family protein n=1 Tax=Janibacter endophyticus TaxID=2806261 RepID=UPI0027DE6160|nr:LCP family protein [Janibacter endophyticus]